MPKRPHDHALKSAQMRTQIAERAGRLMAEHGIRDYALAKRKAARQLGFPEGAGLPSNDEVDQALMQRQSLFEPHGQRLLLSELQEEALQVMQTFDRFNPLLTGAVASGAVSRHSLIELDIQGGSSKDFEQFLVNREIEFKIMDQAGLTAYLIYAEPADVLVRIPSRDRHPGHSPQKGHLSIEQLRKRMQTTY
jgi:hypothetical protein